MPVNIGLLASYLALTDESDSGIGQHYRILADTLAAYGHRVHVVHPTIDPGQASLALAALAPEWTCDVVPARPPGWLGNALRWSWPSQLLLTQLWMARAADRALADSCRKHRLQVIETHAYEAPALFFLRRRQRPKVLTRVSTSMAQMIAISSLHSRVRGWQAALERVVTRRSDALVTHSAQHRDALCALEGHDAARFAIVPHGLPDPGEPLPTEGPAAGTIEFLYVGRFESRKGINVLLAAIPEIIRDFPQAIFTLAGSRGDGVDWHDFERRHPELLGNRVVSLGRVTSNTLAALYRRCHVLVAPSRYESFGLIYIEAMSHAKPVIGCRAGGVPEVIQQGVTGLMAEPGDVASLIACMRTLASDADLRRRMGEAARLDFLTRFSARRLAEASVELYRQISFTSPGE
jgi:glycosyltransferase involved in cell wall biosynthesis